MKLSVIIPIYNSARWLDKCLSCYLSQTYKNVEFILVDDGSTDASFAICSVYNKKYDNVKLIHQSNNGVSSARNVGLKVASGEYISFLDSDDYIDCEMFSDMMELAVTNELDVVSCGISVELEINDKCYVQSQIKYGKDIMVFDQTGLKEQMLSMWEKSVPYNIWNKIYRKKLLDDNNIYFSELQMGEDLEFNLKVFKVCNKIGTMPKCYYHYIRERNGSATSKYIPNWFDIRKKENYQINNFFLDYLKCSTLPSEYIEFTSRRFVIRSLGCIENECKHKNTRLEIVKSIVTDEELQKCLLLGQRYSFLVKLLIMPIRYKLIWATIFEFSIIGNIRKKYPRMYEYLKYKKIQANDRK